MRYVHGVHKPGELRIINQNRESEEGAIQIYTYGSKIKGRVRAALLFWNHNLETRSLKLSLPPYCTVYQVEVLAICEASRIIPKYGAATFAIFSKSTAALQTVVNLNSLHSLAVETRFFWT